MKKILVAYDGSKMSDLALSKAIDISKPTSKIHVLYVIDEDEVRWPTRIDVALIWGGSIAELEKNILEIHKNYAKNVLKRAENIAKKKNKKIKAFFEVGFPAEKILETAERLRCDLIVLASRSKSQIEFLLGSVAEKVVARSKIPVLVVKR